jgi:hypothetical protein
MAVVPVISSGKIESSTSRSSIWSSRPILVFLLVGGVFDGVDQSCMLAVAAPKNMREDG